MAKARIDLTGRVIGRLTVLRVAGQNRFRNCTWMVRCECGAEKVVSEGALTAARPTRSCGCLRRDQVRAASARARKEHDEEILRLGKKVCTKCATSKPLSEFPRADGKRRRVGGVHSYCRKCAKDASFRSTYGISLADKQTMIDAQSGLCAIRGCGRAVDMWAAMDHCHESGGPRAVLCRMCNTALGLLGENLRRMEGLIAYARKWKQLRLVPARETA